MFPLYRQVGPLNPCSESPLPAHAEGWFSSGLFEDFVSFVKLTGSFITGALDSQGKKLYFTCISVAYYQYNGFF